MADEEKASGRGLEDTKKDRQRRLRERFYDRREKLMTVLSFSAAVVVLVLLVFLFYSAGNIFMTVLLIIIALIVSAVAIFAIDHVFYETE